MALRDNGRLSRFLLLTVAVAVVTIYIIETFSSLVNAGVTTAAAASLGIKQITAGNNFSCGIASDNNAYCWGQNNYGQLGIDSTVASSTTPVAVYTAGALSGKRILSLSAGNNHVCAIASDNNAYCWGYNNYGQLGDNSTTQRTAPVAVYTAGALSGKTILSISAGGSHTCAIASNNLAYCWGYNGVTTSTGGMLGDNSYVSKSYPVAVYTAGALSGKTILSISAGGSHTCAIASNNLAYCWGQNGNGRLGNNSTTRSLVPVAVYTTGVLSGLTVKSVSAGYAHTCAIASNNAAYCWGWANYGQLGNNSTTQSSVPVAVYTTGVLSGLTVKSVSAGYAHTCAIASNNAAYCWGYNNYGQLGNNSTTQSLVPVAAYTSGALSGKTILSISAESPPSSTSHNCVVASDNNAYCWGYNGYYQLGNGLNTNSSVPVAVASIVQSESMLLDQSVYRLHNGSSVSNPGSALADTNSSATLPYIAQSFRIRFGLTSKAASAPLVQQIATGDYSGCAVADYKAYCWGGNSNGTLGNGSTAQSNVPMAVDASGVLSGKSIRFLRSGWMHTCAIASDNNAYCWGYNSAGQLGDNSNTNRTSPVAVNTSGVLSGKTVVSLATGDEHTCAIASDNNAYCWGTGAGGRLGNNSTSGSYVPVAVYTSGVLSGKSVRAVATGTYHSCAIASDNLAYCWGTNGTYGALGNNSTAQSNVPVAVNTSGVLSGKTIRSIVTSGMHTCVIASDNLAYCWGYNDNGQLGNNSTTSSLVPVAVNTSGVLSGKTIRSISVAWSHSCVIASDNLAYCWGYNAAGALGNNSASQSSVPVAVNTSGVLSGKTLKSIYTSNDHTCVIASDDQSYCWGSNSSGELGIGSTDVSLVPVSMDESFFADETYSTIAASALRLKLEYAPKGAMSSCNQVSGTWSGVSGNTAISYDDLAPNDGLSIGSLGSDDPTLPANYSLAYRYQTTIRGTSTSVYTFTNASAIKPNETALWDFVLRDRTATASTSYCFRLVTDTTAAPGTSIDTYSEYPELTTAYGDLGVRFADDNSTTLTNPTTAFSGGDFSSSNQLTTAALSNASSQQLEVNNSASSTGWSVSLAATNGPSSVWTRSDLGATYPYNGATAANGQLSINTAASTFEASGNTPDGSSCSTAGLTFGSSQTFQSGVTDAITIASASSSSGFNCSFKLHDVVLGQTIPQYQSPGSYSLNMTVTVLAQ